MEQQRVRMREAEPGEGSDYEQSIADYQKLKEQRLRGRVVIRGADNPFQQNRQGLIKHYVNGRREAEQCAGGWNSFIHEIHHHSGRHRHQGGTSLFVIEGKGYTTVNGRRFDWNRGDVIQLPVQAGGCEHQHFNEDESTAAKWLSLINYWGKLPMANELVQREVSPDWKKNRPDADEGIPNLDKLDEDRLRVQREQAAGELKARTDGTLFSALLDQRDRERQRLTTARMVLRAKDIKLELNEMGLFYWYVHPSFQDVGSRTVLIYVQEIPPGSRSGRQLHQGGRLHYVWQGRGHTMIDGVRHDWQAGDEILLPLRWEGVIHQHFNDSQDEPVKLVCAEGNLYDTLGVDLGSGFDVFDVCPEYRAKRA